MITVEQATATLNSARVEVAKEVINTETLRLMARDLATGGFFYLELKKTNGQTERIDVGTDINAAVNFFNFMSFFAV